MAKFKKICVITGTRAEYGLLRWTMEEIKHDLTLTLQVIATGTHLSSTFGFTAKEIEADGFQIDVKITLPVENTTDSGTSLAVSQAIAAFSQAYTQLQPDLILVLGDRTEILAACTAALIHRIPIAHIHGGEITEGAFDDAIRHAITKMAFLHFPAAKAYRKRILQMGENPEHVQLFGTPGLESLKRLSLLDKAALEKELGFSIHSPLLVTYHPVTLEKDSATFHMKALLDALDAFPDRQIFFTFPNSDPDHAAIRSQLEAYVQKNKARCHAAISLGQKKYLSLLRLCSAVVGNSSSGIIEAPATGVPTVNIGDRQKGRLMASSVISCGNSTSEIIQAIQKGLNPQFSSQIKHQLHPYLADDTSKKIVSYLKSFDFSPSLLKKGFFDVSFDV